MTRIQKKTVVTLIAAVFALALVAGCGGGEADNAAAEKTADTTEVAVHDCDGGCGMKDVAVDEMTVVDGKYYCAGCAKKAEGEDHSGHDHQ